LQLSGKGTLVLETPVTVGGLHITDGGTLVVSTDNALRLVDNNLTIAKGNLVINGEGFNTATDRTLTLTDGNLTLNKPLGEKFKVKMTSGDLTVTGDGDIGNAGNGEVELEAKGRLLMEKDLKLKKLTMSDNSTLEVKGHTLAVIKPGANLTINSISDGTLQLDMQGNHAAILSGDMDVVEFKGHNTNPNLALKKGFTVGLIKVTGDAADKSTLGLEGNNTVRKLQLVGTSTPLAIGSNNLDNTIDFLEPAAGGASLDVTGNKTLYIKDGPEANWDVVVDNGAHLVVKGKKLLSGTVKVELGAALGGGGLTLPRGGDPAPPVIARIK